MLNKRGWTRHSFLYLIVGLIFLYVGLMPFFEFPFTFEVSLIILKVVLAIEGLLILIESFKSGINFSEIWWKVILGLVFFVFAVGILLMDFKVIPISFIINESILQVAVIVYAIWMIVQAFMQEL